MRRSVSKMNGFYRLCGRSLWGSRDYLGGVPTPLQISGISGEDCPQRWIEMPSCVYGQVHINVYHRVCGRSLRGSRPYLGGISTPLLTPRILCGDRPQRWGWTSCKYTRGPMQGFLVPDTKLLPQRLHCNPVLTGWERATRGKMKGIKGCGKELSIYTR